jgi:8-oxo-dGTP pyrophosphatase MutT (NUDIX family)
MTQDPALWTVNSSREAFANRWLRIAIDEVSLPDGRAYEYTRIEPVAPGVGVIGFNDAGEILLEREYRHGVGEVIWQIPGGLADPAEELQAAGLRELREETGYAPRLVSPETVRYLGCVWDNPAFGPAHSHTFAVQGLVRVGDPKPDLAEAVTLHWVSPQWLCQAVASGEIKDRVVVSAVAYLLLNGLLG